ncbi:MAG: NfeD family protein [Pirellulales bacterium]|nr:NfeD family protein [Pirellulales bacterium]
MDFWAWAVLLLLLGLGLVILEVFIPSGGILGFLAFCSLAASVVTGFLAGPGTGLAVLGVTILGLPVIVISALHYWPHTPIGRRILLDAPESDEVLPDSPKRQQLKALIGRVGHAKTKMLPSGVVAIHGRTVDALSDGPPIEAGQKVRVVDVRGNRVLVHCVDDETPSEADIDPLARPIDSISGDPFQDSSA